MQKMYYRGRNNVSKKPGDWSCDKCGNLNFAKRDNCKRCGRKNPIEKQQERKRGDWNCMACGTLNFASREQCFHCTLKKGGEEKAEQKEAEPEEENAEQKKAESAEPEVGAPPQIRDGDWLCPGCSFVNWGSRKSCMQCGTNRKEEGTCAACWEAAANCCLKNCGHVVVCMECAGKLDKCPACRVPYSKNGFVRVFDLTK